MAFLGDGGSLARLSHSIQKELKVGDTVVVVASAHDEHIGARGVVKQVNSAAAVSGQFAYQVEILIERKQPSEHKQQPVRWWFSRLQLSPAPKGGSPEKSRGRLPGAAEDSQTSPRADKDPETITDDGQTATIREGDHPKAAHLALAAERERVEELALKQKLNALKQRSSGAASLSQRRRDEVSAERRAPSRRPQSASAARSASIPSTARKAPPSIPSRPQSAKPGPRPHSAKGPHSSKGPRSVGTERNASPPRRVPGSAPFVLGRSTSPLGADAACEVCEPQPDYMHEPGSVADAAASPLPVRSPERRSRASSPGRLVARDEGDPWGEGDPREEGDPRRRRVAADQQGWREAGEQHETRVQTFRRWVSDEHAPPPIAEAAHPAPATHPTCHTHHLPHTTPATHRACHTLTR